MEKMKSSGGEHRTASNTLLPTKFQSLAVTSLADSAPALHSSYNQRIRPLLDAIEKLRCLNVMQEGIQLPTIVVVGDQSSGKSSVLESLAGISLPRGQGICTRVPLIMRLQHHPNTKPELHLHYHEKKVSVDEAHISEAIKLATDEIAGDGKGISNNPLTLVVKKNGVPDLTMIDLPGITRVAVQGQPQNIYERISDIIMEHIQPEESIILNVLSASVDFPTCESIRMSQLVDRTGQRTLGVVTKADKSPEGLLEKVTTDDVNIGLGYVCVRNRIGDETYEEARAEEAKLFNTHPQLSMIDKSMVGIGTLAQRLVLIQSTIISKCLPEIVRKINDKLNSHLSELSKMPKSFTSATEALVALMHMIGSYKDSLRKIIIQGDFHEYPDDEMMHSTVRLVEMLNHFSNELHNHAAGSSNDAFLLEEIKELEEAQGIGLPNFISRSAFRILLQRRLNAVSGLPVCFVEETWNYIEIVVIKVLSYHCENYPQLISSTRRAAQNLIAKAKGDFTDRVLEIIEMEKLTDFTCDSNYMTSWKELMENHKGFDEAMNSVSKPPIASINTRGFGAVKVEHLRGVKPSLRNEAFDLKMRITAYWKIVTKRLVDCIALQLQFRLKNLVNKEMDLEIMNELMGSQGGSGIDQMLEETPSVAAKKERLNKSIVLLKESKEIVAKVMDTINLKTW